MDLVQGLRAALRALGNSKTFAGGIQLNAESDGSVPLPPSKAVFQQHFEVVFLDTYGWDNIAAHISRSQLAEVRESYHQLIQTMLLCVRSAAIVSELAKICAAGATCRQAYSRWACDRNQC